MSGSPPRDPVVVYRTLLLHEADLVAESMARGQIPYFRRVETSGGLSVTLAASPPPGLMPGNCFAIAVPEHWATRARRFIARLPVSQELAATHQMPGIKEMFRGRVWIFVLAIIAALVWTLIRMYTE